MHSAVRDGRAPSAIAMLARDDEVLWLKSVGEMGPGVPMRADAILPLASVGKMYTAVAAMILVERRTIALDDPVAKYIPQFAGLGITVHHLLTHTGGLTVRGDSFWAAWNAHSEKTTATELAKALAALPIQSKPGERFDYGPTGASYEVLGAVIEIASGQTLEAFMTQNIFEPLGLSETFFYLPAAQAQRLPAFYRKVDGALRPDRAQGEDFPRSTYFHGGGGVQASPRDIQRFARLFLDGGTVDGVRVLSPKWIRLMMTDHLGSKAPQGRGYTWGYGAALMKGPAGETAQYGWSGGGYATFVGGPRARDSSPISRFQ
ncbi:MAG: beta-lactamase family protein [Gammaproteobacteria bacterium]|nr:beta-lactamase family protein [Gammaproteobacteria bacterium]